VIAIQSIQQPGVVGEILIGQVAQRALLLVEKPERIQRHLQLRQVIDLRQQVGEKWSWDRCIVSFSCWKAGKGGHTSLPFYG
jgi:hypothetical protein